MSNGTNGLFEQMKNNIAERKDEYNISDLKEIVEYWDRQEVQVVCSYDKIEKGFFDNEGDKLEIQYWRELPSTDGLKFDFGNN